MTIDRKYFAKPVEYHWEIWFRHSDNSPDPNSGATEWRAAWGTHFWRKRTAERLAMDFQREFNDGKWIGENQ